MNENSLVSILVPCYNHESFLKDCLASIINQSYSNIELLICDDNSNDASFEIIKSYEDILLNHFKRVIIIKNEINQGVTKTLNKLIRQSNGTYIKIIASDDAMTTDAIEQMIKLFQNNQDYDIIVSNGVKIDEYQHYPKFSALSVIYPDKPNFNLDGFFERVAMHNEIFAPGVMIKKSIYDTYGLYDETINIEDFEYWLRLLKTKNIKFGYLEDKLIYYRVNRNSMSSSFNNTDLEKRRRYFHEAIMKTYQKHEDAFHEDTYIKIVSKCILNELFASVQINSSNWECTLKNEWNTFIKSRKLPLYKYYLYQIKYMKLYLYKLKNILKNCKIE